MTESCFEKGTTSEIHNQIIKWNDSVLTSHPPSLQRLTKKQGFVTKQAMSKRQSEPIRGRPPAWAGFHSLDRVPSIWRHTMTATKLFVVAEECLVGTPHGRRSRREARRKTRAWMAVGNGERSVLDAKVAHALVSKDTRWCLRYGSCCQQVEELSYWWNWVPWKSDS